MNNKELNIKEYELVRIVKKEGIFRTETGQEINFTNYYIDFKRKDNPLVMRAKLEKVFKDYIENDPSGDGETVAPDGTNSSDFWN